MNHICQVVGRRPCLVAALAALSVCVPGLRPAWAADGDRGKATAEYLQRMKAIEEEGYNKGWKHEDLQGKIDAVRECADDMDDVSGRGVDEEAADLVDARAKFMKRAADYENDYGEDARAALSMVRDALADDSTRALDERRAIESQRKELDQMTRTVRKHLEAKYDQSFTFLLKAPQYTGPRFSGPAPRSDAPGFMVSSWWGRAPEIVWWGGK